MYFNLREALNNVPAGNIVIAEDVTAAGQKRFIVSPVSKLVTLYQTLKCRHWYECLVENKASRIFLDVESERRVDIEGIVDFFRQMAQLQFKVQPIFEIIDSCSEHKSSWHVICTNIYLTNVYHVGAFVRKTVMAMTMGNHPDVEAIDTAVYTKNRMFRITGSTKFGSERVLTHHRPWYELLVQSPGSSAVWKCLELDKSEPQSTSAAPSSLFQYDYDVQKWIRLTAQVSNYSTRTTYCSLLNPIIKWLNANKQANISRHKISMNNYGQYLLPCSSTKCSIANRCHKGNNIWFVIYLHTQTVYQKCFDSDCAGKSQIIPVPSYVWNDWNNTWQPTVEKIEKDMKLGSHE